MKTFSVCFIYTFKYAIFISFIFVYSCGASDIHKELNHNDSITISELFFDSATIEHNRNNYAKSLYYLNEALKYNKNDYYIIFNRMNLYYILKDYKKTITECERLINMDSTHEHLVYVYYIKGKALKKLNYYIEALNCYNKMFKLIDHHDMIMDSLEIATFYYDRYLLKRKLNQINDALKDSISAHNYGFWNSNRSFLKN